MHLSTIDQIGRVVCSIIGLIFCFKGFMRGVVAKKLSQLANFSYIFMMLSIGVPIVVWAWFNYSPGLLLFSLIMAAIGVAIAWLTKSAAKISLKAR